MHTIGHYVGAQRTLDGDLAITLAVGDEIDLTELEDKDLVIDISQLRKKRSLNANAYFWKLCGDIAKKLGTDKDVVYLMQLKAHGHYEVLEVIADGIDILKPLYRHIDIDHYYSTNRNGQDGEIKEITMAVLLCYEGSSNYDTKQMSDLIDGTVADAHDLGIETWTEEEIKYLLEGYKQTCERYKIK